MWFLNQEGEEFRALSYGDKWRLSRCLARGETLRDPRLASAAIELGESYERRGRDYKALIRWAPIFLLVLNGCLLVSAVIEGDQWRLIMSALIVLGSAVDLVFSPVYRPKNMARSVDAARQLWPQ
jgi:hypothetical protein